VQNDSARCQIMEQNEPQYLPEWLGEQAQKEREQQIAAFEKEFGDGK